MKKLTFILAFLWTGSAFAQNETNHWFFGMGAGLNFSTLPPTPLAGSVMSTAEGSSSVSDPVTGALLFYSDGVTVWDATHTAMPNGTGLMGNGSSTQSCLIVPMPDTNDIFYIFTSDCLENVGANGFRYSVVNMNLHGGLGDVVNKNVLLYAPNTEQLCATKHENCRDWWVMSKMLNNDVYCAYLLTPTGVTGPVLSTLGLAAEGFSAGQAKFSPDGTKYASAIANGTGIQLCDFDNSTGLLSNNIVLMDTDISMENCFAVTFSGDNTKLYASRGGMLTDIYQYDLSSGVAATILASGTSIGFIPGFGTMQMGKDYKIYITSGPTSPNISVINNPNVLGVGCNLLPGSVPITGTAFIGICNFPDSYFNQTTPCPSAPTLSVSATNVSCHGENDGIAIAQIFGGTPPYDIVWMPGGFTNDTVTGLSAGTYTVTYTDSTGATGTATVNITDPPPLTVEIIGPDTICQGNIIISADVTGGTGSYLFDWSVAPGDSLDEVSFTPDSSLDVYVEVEDGFHCTASDTLHIHVIPVHQVQASDDTCICKGQNVILTATGTPYFLWNTGDTTASITVSPITNTTYYVLYDSAGCITSDFVNVCVYEPPVVSISGTDSVCLGSPVTLVSTASGGSGILDYDWSVTALTTPTITFTPPASVLVNLVVTDANGCSDTALYNVTVFSMANLFAGNDTCICQGQTVELSATGAPAYHWSNGQSGATITVSPPTSTPYVVSYLNGICDAHDTVNICVYPLPVISASNDTTIGYGTSVPLEVNGTGDIYWSPSTGLDCITCDSPMATPETSALYTVTVTDDNGCMASEEVYITVEFIFTIPNIITPNGDGVNDLLRIAGLPPHCSLNIFNRWGNPVFVTEDYQNDWPGSTNGVYYYVLRDPTGKTYRGFVQVNGN